MKKKPYQRTYRTKTSGFTIAELLVSVSIMAVVLLFIAKGMDSFKTLSKATTVKWRVQHVADAMQRYYTDYVIGGGDPTYVTGYPADMDTLKASPYLNACTAEQAIAGECIDFAVLPIGGGEPLTITTSIVGGYPEFALSFSIASAETNQYYRDLKMELSKIAGFTLDTATDIVTIQYQRPGNLVNMNNKVSRDGSTPMTNDWDFGGFDLDNVRFIKEVEDISIKGVNDRTVLTGLRNTGSVIVRNNNGVLTPKPTCPTGYTPQIEVSKVGTGVSSVIYEPRNDLAWTIDEGTQWRIMYRVSGKKTNTSSTPHSIIYEGVVAYSTWCGV